MGAKGEIGWKRRDEEGERVKICAEPSRDNWRFYQQYRRYDTWEEMKDPPLEDWINLLDAVRRRISRKKIPMGEDKKLIRHIKSLFPDAEI
jgi:hypothetical protein